MPEVKKVETSYNVIFSITEPERIDIDLGVNELKNFLAKHKDIMSQDTYEFFQETLDALLKIVNFKK